MDTVARLSVLEQAPSANGHSKPKRRKATKRATTSKQVGVARTALAATVGMGVGIPALTLSLSTVAGRMAMGGHTGLALGAAAVGITVLAVSLDHLRQAIEDITGSPKAASWALAVAVDASIVLAESVQVFAPGVVDSLAAGILWAVTAASMGLNVWAFLRHK